MIIEGIHTHGMKGAHRSIRRQKKIFIQLGLPNVDSVFDGTINIDTSPSEYKIVSFDYFFKGVRHRSFPRRRLEDFGFIVIEELLHNNIKYKNWGYMYFPHKSPHFEVQHIFELIGPKLKDLKKNDLIEIKIQDERLEKI